MPYPQGFLAAFPLEPGIIGFILIVVCTLVSFSNIFDQLPSDNTRRQLFEGLVPRTPQMRNRLQKPSACRCPLPCFIRDGRAAIEPPFYPMIRRRNRVTIHKKLGSFLAISREVMDIAQGSYSPDPCPFQQPNPPE